MTERNDAPSIRCATTAGIALLLATVGGCSWFGGGDKEQVATTRPILADSVYESDRPVAAGLQPTNRPVIQEKIPFVYLVETDSTFRVSNVATGEEIAVFPAKAGQIVQVAPRGVMLANKPVMGAQLAPGTYALERIVADSGMLHVEQTHSMPTMPPATRPASAPPTSPPAAPASQ